ncbi:MAG: hypothetical protein CM15mP70_10740 [Pelagibacteraceae bacterium]|nr:MAG: hypothetical protein CM15mP70_10740 [Pelagibacteraceae bacterium]
MGAQMIKEVANKTNDLAGDGTTTSLYYAKHSYRRYESCCGAGLKSHGS